MCYKKRKSNQLATIRVVRFGSFGYVEKFDENRGNSDSIKNSSDSQVDQSHKAVTFKAKKFLFLENSHNYRRFRECSLFMAWGRGGCWLKQEPFQFLHGQL